MEANTQLNTSLSKKSKELALTDVLKGSIKGNIRQYTMVIALLSIWLIFTALTKGIFITPRNLSNLFLQSASVAILATGMVLIIVAGHINLGVGRVVGFTGAVAAYLMVYLKFNTLETIIITIVLGILIGTWEGFWVAYRKVPAFIVTLATMMVCIGGIIGVTHGQSIGPMMNSFKLLGQGYLPKLFFKDAPFHDTSILLGILCIIIFIFTQMKRRSSRKRYGFPVLTWKVQILKIIGASVIIAAVMSIMVLYMGVPYAVLVVALIVVLLSFLASRTTFGRHIYAIGGNPEAAKLSGINIRKRTMALFMLMGLLSSIAGIVYTARINTAASSAGANMELDAIASAVIGGTSLMGGKGTIFGAIIGAIVIASLDNGMSLMNIDVTYQYVVKGLILLLAVWVDMATQKKA